MAERTSVAMQFSNPPFESINDIPPEVIESNNVEHDLVIITIKSGGGIQTNKVIEE
jgi:hypothetical protein